MRLIIFIFLFICLVSFSQRQEKTISFYFGSNKSTLSKNESKRFSDFLLIAIEKQYKLKSLIAFTDSVGSIEFNQNLAQKRANTISAKIIGRKIQLDSIQIKGESYSDQVANIGELKQWRRVDITYLLSEINPPPIFQSNDFKVAENVIPSRNKFQKFLETAKKDEAIALNVQFYGGTADMLPNSMSEIDDLYNFLVTNNNYSALIRGHVCCHDDMPLSVQRANVVYQILLNRGIPPRRLDFRGYSNSLPVVSPEISEDDRQQNRRVDVIFSK